MSAKWWRFGRGTSAPKAGVMAVAMSRPRPSPVRKLSVSAPRPCPQPVFDHAQVTPQPRPRPVHVRDRGQAANVRIQPVTSNYPCPVRIRARFTSGSV